MRWILATSGEVHSKSWLWLGGVQWRKVGMVGIALWEMQCISKGANEC